jgi:uncharacterized protein (TIGR03083 family)
MSAMTKETLLQEIRVERRRLETNLARLSDEEMLRPGICEFWTAKDLLAHLLDWEQRFLGWYAAGRRGETPELPAPGLTWGQLDELNRQVYEAHRDRPLDEVRAQFAASYAELLAAVESMSPEEIIEPGHYAWTGGGELGHFIAANSSHHYRWAKDELRQWMKTQGML